MPRPVAALRVWVERTLYGISPFMDVALRDQNRRVACNFGHATYAGPSFCEAGERDVAQHVGFELLDLGQSRVCFSGLLKNGKSSLSRAVPWQCCD